MCSASGLESSDARKDELDDTVEYRRCEPHARQLLQTAAEQRVDYSHHAARMSRQVGCRTVLKSSQDGVVEPPFEARPSNIPDLLTVDSLVEIAVPDGSRLTAKRSLLLGSQKTGLQVAFDDVRAAARQDFPVVAVDAGEVEIAILDEHGQPVAHLLHFERTALDAEPGIPPRKGNVLCAKWVRYTPTPADRDLAVYLIHR